MAWFHRAKPGDKVVCVASAECINHARENFPLKIASVYTINEVLIDPYGYDGVFFALEGISTGNPLGCAFGSWLFRPIQPKSTEASMAALRAHLNTKEVPVDA